MTTMVVDHSETRTVVVDDPGLTCDGIGVVRDRNRTTPRDNWLVEQGYALRSGHPRLHGNPRRGA